MSSSNCIACALLPAMWVLIVFAPASRAADSTVKALQAQAATATSSSDDSYAPRRHQLDFELSDFAAFPTDDSLIRRREASIAGSALHWGPDLGVTSYQQPGINGTFWFDDLNALQFQFRYFALYGSSFLGTPVTFNGNAIAPGQHISTSGTTWFTGGVFYERRITPWLERQTANLPHFLQGWDVRPKIGLEFVYLDFQIDNGHPALISGHLDVRGRWHDQELPIPTIGVEGRRWLRNNLLLEGTLQGNWINKWNSLRNQGGTVYLSQSSFETHWRLYYVDQHLMGLKPFLGFAYYFYKQAEASREIGNLARMQAFGPEFGVNYSFRF
jgi:hypothetical protein